ncbi:MAG: phospholipid carrier-dependent glycosyltransferase [Nitrososphaerales archaeon]|nr:phospholipid carrier-dependent glycosyltransferase [Nitrososphaerales archaeon]
MNVLQMKIGSLPVLSIILTLLAFLIRIWRLEEPNALVFDEFYYAQAAYSYVKNLTDPNWVHPPLGKEMISIGILIFGYNPFGWRIVSAIIGALSITIIYLTADEIFRKPFISFSSAFILTFDPFHFIHSRIALLDIFLAFFILTGFYAYVKYIKQNVKSKSLIWLVISSITFGLALATKWPAIFAILAAILLPHFGGVGKEGEGGVVTIKPLVGTPLRITLLLTIPATIYMLTYLPHFIAGKSLEYWYLIHKETLIFHLTVKDTHPYASPPWLWLLPLHRIPYYLDLSTGAEITTILNPIIVWVGLPSTIVLMINSFKRDSLRLAIPFGFLFLYLPWFLSPRMTFLFYLLPANSFLILATSWLLEVLWDERGIYRLISISCLIMIFVIFIIFYPRISALRF